tara:strand:+ start:1761 stop:1910 length:150 start_codon:yes stop_codon:yes gene_type:complete
MGILYLISGALIALILPHLTSDSVGVIEQVILQIAFIAIGFLGFKTFEG